MLGRFLSHAPTCILNEEFLIKGYFGNGQRLRIINKSLTSHGAYCSPTGGLGSGAGKGGGAGGSVRESGGGLGQFGAAQEEQFFYNKQREQLEKMKKKLKDAKSEDLTRKEGK